MSTNLLLPIEKKYIEKIDDAVLFINEKKEIIWGNQSAYIMLNTDQELPGQSIETFFDFDLLKNNPSENVLITCETLNNLPVEIKTIEINRHTYCMILKVKKHGEKIETIKTSANKLIHSSTEGMVIFNKEKIIDCDLEFATLFGYSHEEIIGKSLIDLIDPRGTDELVDVVDDHLTKSLQLIGIRQDDTTFHIELFYHPYNDQENILHIAIVKDITKRIKNEKKLEYMAYYDELTDLPNQNYFIKILNGAIQSAKKNEELLAVSFIDLDYFKEINETIGYDFGDKLLAACGKKLKKYKSPNIFIARMSGDKFLVLQKTIKDRNVPIQLAKDLIKEFEEPVHMSDYDIFLSISIGISIYPENGETSKKLIKHANSAMYMIKEEHLNNYKLFESSISSKFKMMLTMERDLRKALKYEQFELHYQPQKCLRTNELVGMEALLRWNHPEKGYIPPLDFIPLAEKTGLIIEIGDWVIKEACKQNKLWQDKGYQPIIVSVNLSVKQFHQKDLLEKINQTLLLTDLEPKYLEVEITESMAMTNEVYMLQTMNRLRDLGVHVSIDDFGTGYSSLKYLSMFPVTKLKIDKMFMDRDQKQNETIVKSIINMSHSLDIRVIAEGVETISQMNFLEKENCDEMQGFYFSKPLPPKQLTKFFK